MLEGEHLQSRLSKMTFTLAWALFSKKPRYRYQFPNFGQYRYRYLYFSRFCLKIEPWSFFLAVLSVNIFFTFRNVKEVFFLSRQKGIMCNLHSNSRQMIIFRYVDTSVPDPKLIISDPDPLIENQEFRIRIRILDPDPGSRSFCNLRW